MRDALAPASGSSSSTAAAVRVVLASSRCGFRALVEINPLDAEKAHIDGDMLMRIAVR
jgi:hypothetical protein